jgi:hypothetical protein
MKTFDDELAEGFSAQVFVLKNIIKIGINVMEYRTI